MHLAHFWFTLFHEAGNFLNVGKREVLVDVENADDPCELEANAFACHLLIPPRYKTELPGLKSRIGGEDFARRIGIDPGIVVGRLRREGLLPYTHLNGQKVKFEWK